MRTTSLTTFATKLNDFMREYEKKTGVLPRINRIESPKSKGTITIYFDNDLQTSFTPEGTFTPMIDLSGLI